MELGAGRAMREDLIDLSVGIVLNKKRGDIIKKGDIIAYVHGNDELKSQKAVEDVLKNYNVSQDHENNIPLIYSVVR
jgi:pyrimidine-nucleoside phosphorylase